MQVAYQNEVRPQACVTRRICCLEALRLPLRSPSDVRRELCFVGRQELANPNSRRVELQNRPNNSRALRQSDLAKMTKVCGVFLTDVAKHLVQVCLLNYAQNFAAEVLLLHPQEVHETASSSALDPDVDQPCLRKQFVPNLANYLLERRLLLRH